MKKASSMQLRCDPQEAFDYWVALGFRRTFDYVAEHFRVPREEIAAEAQRNRWAKRLKILHEKVDLKMYQRLVETVEKMNARHVNYLRWLQRKALKALVELPFENAIDAVKALEIAIKQERLVRGEPTEKTAVSIEAVIRREYERWMTIVQTPDGQTTSVKIERPPPTEELEGPEEITDAVEVEDVDSLENLLEPFEAHIEKEQARLNAEIPSPRPKEVGMDHPHDGDNCK